MTFLLTLLRVTVSYSLVRSRHHRFSIKKGVLKTVAEFTGKHLYQSLFFNKIAVLRPATILKKRLWHRCFPVNFAKFSGIPFRHNISEWLLLSGAEMTWSNSWHNKLLKKVMHINASYHLNFLMNFSSPFTLKYSKQI